MNEQQAADTAEADLMQWMTIDQLDRFGDANQAMEDIKAEWEKIREEAVAQNRLHERASPEELAKHCALSARLDHAVEVKQEIIAKLIGQFRGFGKLEPMGCEAMEQLVNDGVTPTGCGGSAEFFARVYRVMLQRWGKEIATDPTFKNVEILKFLNHVFVNRLALNAGVYRQRGNPVLAQIMEELAESQN